MFTDSNSTIASASFTYLLKLRGLLIDSQQSVHCSLSFGYHIPLDLGHHDAELEKVRSLAIFLGRRDLTGLCSIAPALLQLPPRHSMFYFLPCTKLLLGIITSSDNPS